MPRPDTSGLQCVALLAGLLGTNADLSMLFQRFGQTAADLQTLQQALIALGLQPVQCAFRRGQLVSERGPCIVLLKDGSFCLVGQRKQVPEGRRSHDVSDSGVSPGAADSRSPPLQSQPKLQSKPGGKAATVFLVQVPGQSPCLVDEDIFLKTVAGPCLWVRSGPDSNATGFQMASAWFGSALLQEKSLIAEILLVCVGLQIIGLSMPLFFQVVMDKVLVNQARSTLHVIVAGLLICSLLETLVTGLRGVAVSRLGARLDVTLGQQFFSRLLSLPLRYFEARKSADTLARIQLLDSVRSFVTGPAITAVLDAPFCLLLFAVMLLYSPSLALIVLLALLFFAAISVLFSPILRQRFESRFRQSAAAQAFLVEALSGIATLKSQALEPIWLSRWERHLRAGAEAAMRCTGALLVAQGSVSLVNRILTIAILWAGAELVMQQQLTVGELVAFNMLAGQMTGPVLRLSQLWNDCQQVSLGIRRLEEIIRLPAETGAQRMPLPSIVGHVEFDQLTARYGADSADVVRGVSLKVKAGEVIGIVGGSGSGKSTLMQCLQRLLVPSAGHILIDGLDLSLINPASLRKQIGSVSQEPRLFSGTVRENIAVGHPDAAIDSVIDAARRAGAHDFICALPEGYETPLGENGSGLSGGQRQRIALARALMGDPRILILDEATSALDVESELVIQRNLQTICEGRTVFIIAHRLSAVRQADRIVVMDRGRIVEMGPPAMLLQHSGSLFRRMVALQSSALAFSAGSSRDKSTVQAST